MQFAKPDTTGNVYQRGDHDRHANPDQNIDKNGNYDCHEHTDGYPDSHSDGNVDANPNSHEHPNTDSNPNQNIHSYGERHTVLDADRDGDSHGDAYVGPILGVIPRINELIV